MIRKISQDSSDERRDLFTAREKPTPQFAVTGFRVRGRHKPNTEPFLKQQGRDTTEAKRGIKLRMGSKIQGSYLEHTLEGP